MPKVYTIKELERVLHLSERTIFRHLKDGTLTGSKHGKWLFTDEDIKAFLSRGRKKQNKKK